MPRSCFALQRTGMMLFSNDFRNILSDLLQDLFAEACLLPHLLPLTIVEIVLGYATEVWNLVP